MKKGFTALVVLMLALSFSGIAQAGQGYGSSCKVCKDSSKSFEEKYFWKVKFMLGNKDELGLSDEQVDQIKEQKYQIKRQKIEAAARMETDKLDIYHELKKDAPDMGRIDILIDDKIDAKRGLLKSYVNGIVELKAVLTAEQMVKAKALYSQQKSHK